MTVKKKTKPPEWKFHVGQKVVYRVEGQDPDVHSAPATIRRRHGDCQQPSRKSPGKLVWWYHVFLFGDMYPRFACEDELSLPPPAKFQPGDLVEFDGNGCKGSGIVVDVHQNAETYFYTYDIWSKAGELRTPIRINEENIKLAKKPKAGG